jgi:hypothetical protein
MSAIAFDTHDFVKKLKSVGFTEEQAEVFATEHRRIIEDTLVTKYELNVQLRELEYRLIIKLGAMIVVAVGAVATLVKIL